MRTIKISFKTTGEVVIEAVGFKGQSCEQATAALEEALGIKSSDRPVLPDYYESESNGQQVQESQ
jgi:hypothetical protein